MWHHFADPHDRFCHRRPDFLVISPPKTGSTWLAANLRHHPQLFVPEVKEVKYFSSLFKYLDFGWYCDHFTAAGNRQAGEASPSYASLPLATIRLIRQLLPDIKLVFLMREPVSRAWSHAKHNHRYREANFAQTATDTDLVTDDQWRENFAHDWPLVAGDYLGQLRRWTSVFPAEQLFVGFYESIATNPATLLRDVFTFLGVDPEVDLSSFPVEERILPGPPGDLSPELTQALRGLLRARTAELVDFVGDRFGLESPSEWQATLHAPTVPSTEQPAAFRLENDDEYLSGVMQLEETFASGHRRVLSDYRGYDIVFSRGALHAVPRDDARTSREEPLVAPTLSEMKERITTRLLEAASARVQSVEDELRATRDTVSSLSAELAELVALSRRPSLARRLLHSMHLSTLPN